MDSGFLAFFFSGGLFGVYPLISPECACSKSASPIKNAGSAHNSCDAERGIWGRGAGSVSRVQNCAQCLAWWVGSALTARFRPSARVRAKTFDIIDPLANTAWPRLALSFASSFELPETLSSCIFRTTTADMSADEGPRPHLDKAKLKKQFDVSNFDLNAIIRGFQLTLVGGRHQSLSSRTVLKPEYPNHPKSLFRPRTDRYSPPRTPEPRYIHLAALQAGRHCRRCRHRHPPADRPAGVFLTAQHTLPNTR